MFSNQALSVVIGLTFIYLLYSLLGTLLQEILSTNIQLRGIVLRYSIYKMLGDSRHKRDTFSKAFYNHPLMEILRTGNFLSRCPSYIEPQSFSKVVIDLLRGKEIKAGDPVRDWIQKSLSEKKLAWNSKVTIPDKSADYLNTIWIDSQGDIQKFKVLIEDWFTKMMVKTSGWYKQWTQLMLMVIGFVIALTFNVDTLSIIKKLEGNPTMARQIVERADGFVKAHPNLENELQQSKTLIGQKSISEEEKKDLLSRVENEYQANKAVRDSLVKTASALIKNDIAKTNDLLGLGWEGKPLKLQKDQSYPRAFIGWLLTALAISLGAPFWFDLLNKIMQLRGTASEQKKEGSNTSSQNSVNPIDRVG